MRVMSGGVSLGRMIGAGGYLVRLRGRNSGLLVVSYVSGLLGNTDKRTIRGVGLVFGLRRAMKLHLGPSTFWGRGGCRVVQHVPVVRRRRDRERELWDLK